MKNRFDIEKNRLSKQDVFSPPSDRFFDDLEKEILSNTIDKEVEKTISKSLKWYHWPIAALLLLGIGLVYEGKYDTNNGDSEFDILEGISNEDIYAYLEYEDLGDELYEEISLNNVIFKNAEYMDFEVEQDDLSDEIDLLDLEDIYI